MIDAISQNYWLLGSDVFSRLNTKELAVCSLVCKKWREHLSAFDDFLWRRAICCDAGMADHNLPVNIRKILNSSCPFWPEKRIFQTHMFTFIPPRITLCSASKLLKNAFRYSAQEFLHRRWDVPVLKSGWVLLTKDLIPTDKDSPGYQMPSVLEVVYCVFNEFLKTGKRYYGTGMPWSETRCIEESMFVGGFSQDGIVITTTPHSTWGEGRIRYLSSTKEMELPFWVKVDVFSHLNIRDLASCSLVNKHWKQCSMFNDLWRNALFNSEVKKIEAIVYRYNTPSFLRTMHMVVDDVPPLPVNIREILEGPCPFWEHKKIYRTHRLMLIPKTEPAEKSYWVLMVRHCLPRTEYDTLFSQEEKIKWMNKHGYYSYKKPSTVEKYVYCSHVGRSLLSDPLGLVKKLGFVA